MSTKLLFVHHGIEWFDNEKYWFQVIRRKLVHVLTPSTTSEGNIGPDAVHLLAVKEVSIFLNKIEIGMIESVNSTQQ